MSAWLREAGLGARLALAGGRGAWTRTVMTAIGVGLGVALLLLAASVPHALDARDQRSAARSTPSSTDHDPPATDRTVLTANVDTTFRRNGIRGRLLQADGRHPILPPGVDRLPAAGEVVVSPRLRDLLRGDDGALLRPRIPGRIVGTIGDAGLQGPAEAAFYAGSTRLTADTADRLTAFGVPRADRQLDAVLRLLVVIALVVLLLPVAVFVAAAARFGNEDRDRRLAALRLVGADGHMVRRIAAGESLLGAAGGLGVGIVVFLLARQVVPHLSVGSVSLFASDLRPSPALAALIAVAVPALSVVVTQVALTRIAIDPLGVVRRAVPRRRRVLWRVLVPVAGILALLPLLSVDAVRGERFDPVLTAAGVILLLGGITALLPWVVEAVVARLDGGGVAWQLAVRRLQHDAGTPARVVSGIAVAVAGAIALQTLFGAVEADRTVATGADVRQVQADVTVGGGRSTTDVTRRLTATPGVRGVLAYATATTTTSAGADGGTLVVADCATLRRLATLPRCAEGDAFVTGADTVPAGTRLTIDGGARYRVPAAARAVAPRPLASGGTITGVLVTPSAGPAIPAAARQVSAAVTLDAADRDDALERVRNTTAGLGLGASVVELFSTRDDHDLAALRTGITAGAIAVLVLIAASMVVSALEQLHDRRRLLAALVAFGTPQRTLQGSILLQTAVPVALGLGLAIVTGVGLGAFLLRLVGQPISVAVVPVLGIVVAGIAVVPVVTALTIPALRRTTRPEGLRTE